MERQTGAPTVISVRGARVHNLRNVDVDVPLGELVGIAGVSGSGKSSLALGVLYAEGSRRYMDALSTYTRRRIAQAGRAQVDEVLHVPAALALRQRPGIPGVRSTFGTSTELLNHLRLLFSRLGSHVCPNGHHVPPTMAVALEQDIVCPVCGVAFRGPGAEALAFNSEGACPECSGTGVVRRVDEATLVPDESKTIDEGAVLPWGTLMWSLMKDIARDMGVRTDVPFSELTTGEREIVLHGPAEKHHLLYHNEKSGTAGEMDFTYYNAVYTVENALSKVKDEKGLKRVSRFLAERPCPACGGTRLSDAARAPMMGDLNLADATAMTLDELMGWLPTVPDIVPADMVPMAKTIVADMLEPAERLQQLGLGYLSLDRASSTLSTGERQRAQLSRAVRNRTTGVLYVLDEPSIGLHPSNVDGLLGVMDSLVGDGNSVVVVDHDIRVLREADHLIEVGPGSGAEGGTVIAQGSVAEIVASPRTRIGGFLSGERRVRVRTPCAAEDVFRNGDVHLVTRPIHTVQPLDVSIPRGRLTVVTGVSGSGKTTMVLESLVPGLDALIAGTQLPAHVERLEAVGLRRANLIDATPIGVNVRSTVATYSGVLDSLRRLFAGAPAAKERGLKAGDFSYNTGSLRCPTCDGTGTISLDVQFLPDVDIACPDCGGSRYASAAWDVRLSTGRGNARKVASPATGGAVPEHPTSDHGADRVEGGARVGASGSGAQSGEASGMRDVSLPELMAMTIDQARGLVTASKKASDRLGILHELGLGYLTLGEATPALSGGEAQRLKLASEMGRRQDDALFVFDEPTIGLHPLDVELLLAVLQRLMDAGATVVVIEHDLDVVANADWVIDMGPGGGKEGGAVVCAGTPKDVAACEASVTGRYLAGELGPSRDESAVM